MPHITPEAVTAVFDTERQIQVLAEQSKPWLEKWVDAAGKAEAERLARQRDKAHKVRPPTIGWDVSNPLVQEWLKTYSIRLSTSINTTTESMLRDAVGIGIGEGDTLPQIRDRVRSVFATEQGEDIGRYRAELIARTESVRASAQGQFEAVSQSGAYARKYWIYFADCCDFCAEMGRRFGEENAVAMRDAFMPQGSTMTLDDGREMTFGYEPVALPPAHPNCVIGETPVFSPDYISAFVATYSGIVVKITLADGRRLTVTPNHMLLTPFGFATAQSLRKGDNVLDSSRAKRIMLSGPHDNDSPSRIENVVRAATESQGSSSYSVPASPEYLHGDAVGVGDANINIVWPYGLIDDGEKSRLRKHIRKGTFSGAYSRLQSLSGHGDFATMLDALSMSADRIMGERREATPFSTRRACHSQEHGITPPPGLYSSFDEPLSDSSPVNAKHFRQCILRYSGEITLTEIVNVEFDSFHGLVYDLQSLSGLYICNGVVSSNCRCDIGYLM